MLRLPFLHGKSPTSSTTSLLSQYQPFLLPTTQSSTKAIPKSTIKPVYHTSIDEHHLLHKPKHQPRNEFYSEKPVEFTPISVSYDDLLPYLLDNSMVAITPAKVHQPPFLRGYDSNATCAYHGGVLGHSIEHCITSKRKLQSLIDAGWLKFEKNRL